jgi:flagellar FliJ protein
MKGLTTLIKLQKRKLDALRQEITKLEDQRALQEQAIMYLQLQLEEEEKKATENAHLSQFFGDFNKRIKGQQDDCREVIARINRQISNLQEQMRMAFGDLKKLEITEENIKRRAKEETDRREQLMLDEIAMQQFMKKQETPQ